MRWKATATITYYVDADEPSEALMTAAEVAAELEPERSVRYRYQPFTATAVNVEPVLTTELRYEFREANPS